MLGKIPFGEKDGRMLHVGEVPRGDACGCVCPHCKQPLRANKGSLKVHYFSHVPGTECGAGYESALHYAAKQVLLEARAMPLPFLFVDASAKDLDGNRHELVEHLIPEDTELEILNAIAERPIGDIRPDLFLNAPQSAVIVEIAVTHAVDFEKQEKIRSLGFPAIEIDLSDAPRDLGWEFVRERVLDSIHARWIFHPDEAPERAKLKAKLAAVIAAENEKIKARLAEEELQELAYRESVLEKLGNALSEYQHFKALYENAEHPQPLIDNTYAHPLWLSVQKWFDITTLDELPPFLDLASASDLYYPLDRRFWQAIIFHNFIRDVRSVNGPEGVFINTAAVRDWLAGNGLTPVPGVEIVRAATTLGITHELWTASRETIYHKGLDHYFWELCEAGFIRPDLSDGERFEVIFDRYEMPERMKAKLRRQADEQVRRILNTPYNDGYTQTLEAYLAKGHPSARWTCGACGNEYLSLKDAPPNVAKCTHCGAYEGTRLTE
ncbi:MAG: hypothetical protein H6954_05345 [Chromatiaceae bacterium]|nr:hypothetical protein [Chromatiaceae bacterium]